MRKINLAFTRRHGTPTSGQRPAEARASAIGTQIAHDRRVRRACGRFQKAPPLELSAQCAPGRWSAGLMPTRRAFATDGERGGSRKYWLSMDDRKWIAIMVAGMLLLVGIAALLVRQPDLIDAAIAVKSW